MKNGKTCCIAKNATQNAKRTDVLSRVSCATGDGSACGQDRFLLKNYDSALGAALSYHEKLLQMKKTGIG